VKKKREGNGGPCSRSPSGAGNIPVRPTDADPEKRGAEGNGKGGKEEGTSKLNKKMKRNGRGQNSRQEGRRGRGDQSGSFSIRKIIFQKKERKVRLSGKDSQMKILWS